MRSILLAGGGTTGHISPMLAIGRELRDRLPDVDVFALGTEDGLETTIVPAADFELLTIEKVPMPRSLSGGLLRFPQRFAGNISAVRRIMLTAASPPSSASADTSARPPTSPRSRRRSPSSSTRRTRNRAWPTASARP